MEAGDCMYLPAWHIHYVRSTGRNIAGMYMFQTGTKYDPDSCKDYPMKSTSLGDFDILWNFPGAPNTAGYNTVKMGYPDWKKQFRENIARYSRNGQLHKDIFLQWYSSAAGSLGGDEDGDDDDDVQQGRAAAGGAHIWNSISNGKESIPVSELYCNPKLAELFRTVAVGGEGRGEQDLDSRIARFDLRGSSKKLEEHDEREEL